MKPGTNHSLRGADPLIRRVQTLAVALVSLLSPSICPAQSVTVPLEAAKLAAAEKLPTFFPGRWNYYSSVVLYELAGGPAAYAIIFSTAERTPPWIAELEAVTQSRSKDIADLSSRIRGLAARGDRDNRAAIAELEALDKRCREATLARSESDTFATVVTGAQMSSPVVLKVHRGLPTAFSRKYDAEDLSRRARPGQEWRVVRPLYLGTFDDAFEVVPAGADPASVDQAGDTRLRTVVDLRTESLSTVGELTARKAASAPARSPQAAAEEAARQAQNAQRWARYVARAKASAENNEASPGGAGAGFYEQGEKARLAGSAEDSGQPIASYQVRLDLKTGQTSITPDKTVQPPVGTKRSGPGGVGLPPVSKAQSAAKAPASGVKVGTTKAAGSAAGAPEQKVEGDPTKGDTYAVYANITGWTPGTDADGDTYYETYSFDIGIDADASPGPATIYAKMICTTTGQAWWSASSWSVTGTATDYLYFGFDQTDFSGYVTGNTTLDFTVEMWNQAKTSVLATDTTVTGESSVKVDAITSYGVYAIISDWVPGTDADADGYYETYSFNIGVDADASPGPATVYAKMICTTTGQAWWSASSWTVTGTPIDYQYFGFDQTDFSPNVTGNTNLDFTVEIWNQAKTSVLASDASVTGEPVKADYISAGGYTVYGVISGWTPGSDLDGDGYYETYAFNIGVDADATPGPATVYAKMICTTTSQSWWSPSSWTVQGTAADYQYFSFNQTDFASQLSGNATLDFTVEIWNQAKTSLLASDASVSGEPVRAEPLVVVNQIPGASSMPSSVPTYLNNPTMYPLASGGANGICWATATADIFAYWDRNPYNGVTYWNLVHNGIAPLLQNTLPTAPGHDQANVRALVIDLGNRYYGPSPAAEDVIIETVANSGRGLNFNATYLAPVLSLSTKATYFGMIADEIDAGRPASVGSWGTYFGGPHQIPVIGYMDAADGDKFYIHRNTGGTQTEYVNLYDPSWDRLDADIIVPGGTPTDHYENLDGVDDDLMSNAKNIDPEDVYGFRQTHNFAAGAPNDAEDWVKFTAVAGRRYMIRTEHLGASCDTTLWLDDGLLTLSDDNSGPEPYASRIVYDAAASRTVYIRIREQQGRVGHNTNYDISITSEPIASLSSFSKRTPANGATGLGTSVPATWETSTGAASYEVCFDPTNDGACGASWISTSALANTTFGGLAANTTYYWQVRARNASGTRDANGGTWWSFTTQPASLVFTDDPVQSRVTAVRTVHLAELRSAVDALRARFALAPLTWTDHPLVPGGTVVKAVHLTELRAAVSAVYTAAGRTPPTWTTATIVGGTTVITAAHIAELRAAVTALW